MTLSPQHPAGPPTEGDSSYAAAPVVHPFSDLAAFVALPRMSGLTMSPDGSQLVVAVGTPDEKSHRYRSALWRIDPNGLAPATRVTRGATGESSAAFAWNGDLLFTAKRPDPQDTGDAAAGDDLAPLWLLPAGLGEARVIASRAGGFDGVLTADKAPVVVLPAAVLPGSATLAADEEGRKLRKEAGVSAILHSGYPLRFWDHDLGPDQPHLLSGALDADFPDSPLHLFDLTPTPGGGLIEQGSRLSPDGTFVVTGWFRPLGAGDQISEIVRIEVPSGELRVLRAQADFDFYGPRISPDGSRVAYIAERRATPDRAPALSVEVLTLADGTVARPTEGWDRWPGDIAWQADGSGLFLQADQDGRGPVFGVDLAGGPVRQLTFDDATYTDLLPAPDGSGLYAMRTSYLAPAHPVRVALTGEQVGTVVRLPAPHPDPELPGTLVEVSAKAADGTRIRGWLALPVTAGDGTGGGEPAPLLLWIHGGPLGSWNAWSWRWTPWVMVAAGYAVLLPDPALSTGCGQDFIERGWGSWGGAPYTDLMAITDEVERRSDVDASRTAAMGGSFGGYMANWVAGHTDRFRAIVTHASLWSLEEFAPTTDGANYWSREMSAEMTAEHSPHRFVGNISTPMLVIHGDKDYRVPIGQGVRLWYELLSKSQLPQQPDGTVLHRFLYFPSENHWVLTPGHAKLWYQVVLGFLAEHVLGAPAAPVPSLLGGPAGSPADNSTPMAGARTESATEGG